MQKICLVKRLVTKQTGPNGKTVNQLYVEAGAGADIDRELYLSILVNRETGKISFVVSTKGGMDIEAVAVDTPDLVHSIGITASVGCTDADAIKLANALDLTGAARNSGIDLFKTLYHAFVSKDMSLLEINPLIVTKSNELQVLDAKVSFDNNALFRHPDIVELGMKPKKMKKKSKPRNTIWPISPSMVRLAAWLMALALPWQQWILSSCTVLNPQTSLMLAAAPQRARYQQLSKYHTAVPEAVKVTSKMVKIFLVASRAVQRDCRGCSSYQGHPR